MGGDGRNRWVVASVTAATAIAAGRLILSSAAGDPVSGSPLVNATEVLVSRNVVIAAGLVALGLAIVLGWALAARRARAQAAVALVAQLALTAAAIGPYVSQGDIGAEVVLAGTALAALVGIGAAVPAVAELLAARRRPPLPGTIATACVLLALALVPDMRVCCSASWQRCCSRSRFVSAARREDPTARARTREVNPSPTRHDVDRRRAGAFRSRRSR